MSDPFAIDTARVRRSFGRSAGDYDAVAVLQAKVREELLGRLDLRHVNFGPNLTVREIREHLPRAHAVLQDGHRLPGLAQRPSGSLPDGRRHGIRARRAALRRRVQAGLRRETHRRTRPGRGPDEGAHGGERRRLNPAQG